MCVTKERKTHFICEKKESVEAAQKSLQKLVHKGEPNILLCSNTEMGDRHRDCFFRKNEERTVKTESLTPGSSQASDASRRSTEAAPSIFSLDFDRKRPLGQTQSCSDVHFRTAVLFYGKSEVLDNAYDTFEHESEIADFIKLCLSCRCKTDRTIAEICRLIREYHDFAKTLTPKVNDTGICAIFAITKWMLVLKKRGPSVPPKGRYALKVFAEALNIDFPFNHPAVRAAARTKKITSTRHAPPIPLEFLTKIELLSADTSQPFGRRLFCALICLQAFASLRYADLVEVGELWESTSAIVGKSIDQKRDGEIMTWATPADGTVDGKWYIPILEHWKAIAPTVPGTFAPLFPYFEKDWSINNGRKSTAGTVQAALNRLQQELKCNARLRIHSARAWLPTCARQLLYPREDREKLGRWAPGSVMPDRYDRAVCSTELRLRYEILSKVREEQWRPTNSFEVPSERRTTEKTSENTNDDDTSSMESTSETSSAEIDISDLTNVVIDHDGSKGYV